MHRSPSSNLEDRTLSEQELTLLTWMLEQSECPSPFLEQLRLARVVSGCDCGCASINLAIQGYPMPTGGLRIIADFLFGDESSLCGAFVFEQNGVLAGLEVYGLAVDAPRTLPAPSDLRPWKRG